MTLDKIADKVAIFLGSWRFVIGQSILFTIWVILNALNVWYEWDPYPFVFLNLFMSAEAAYATPLILMSQNRQAAQDRKKLEEGVETEIEVAQHVVEMRAAINRIEERLEKL